MKSIRPIDQRPPAAAAEASDGAQVVPPVALRATAGPATEDAAAAQAVAAATHATHALIVAACS